jgi:formylglycine-generating enzyme required for sulfatase activity
VRVPAGEYVVGAAHYRFPHGFWIARTEVTVAQFRRFTSATRFRTTAERAHALRTWRSPGFPQSEKDPVVWLSFSDALAYAKWAGVDLPTQAEWIYASRAGAKSKFFWGDTHDHRYMWHRENSRDRTHPVATKLANAWGLYDMVGNAWEYVRVATPDGRICPDASATLGASWTRCPLYRMRDGRLIDAIEHSIGPVQTTCPLPGSTGGLTSWDDDRGFRCVRRIR